MGNTLPQKEIRTKEGTYLDYDCGDGSYQTDYQRVLGPPKGLRFLGVWTPKALLVSGPPFGSREDSKLVGRHRGSRRD